MPGAGLGAPKKLLVGAGAGEKKLAPGGFAPNSPAGAGAGLPNKLEPVEVPKAGAGLGEPKSPPPVGAAGAGAPPKKPPAAGAGNREGKEEDNIRITKNSHDTHGRERHH